VTTQNTAHEEGPSERSDTTHGGGAEIVFDSVTKQYPGRESPAVDNLSFSIAAGEICMLVGPSGAGKTTVLRAIAGLARPDRGVIALGGEPWFDAERRVDLPPEARSVGLVFQDYALFPHLSVEQNVAYGARKDVHGFLESFGIAHLADERPNALSGGERQRVGLARALARSPDVLLLDEPLAALDTHTRARVRGELREQLERLGLPTLLVTHDFQDAAALAERVGVLVDGEIVQIGSPAELIAEPASSFVADFTGGNLVPGRARPTANGLTEVVLDDGSRVLSTDAGDGRVGIVVHPWEVTVARSAPVDSAQNHVRGEIATIVPVANRVRIRVGPLTAEITAASAERLELRPGDVVVASFKASGTRLVPLA
jgi:molybdate transport system ATP-binding protein